jgi:hypothetical protein
MDWYHVKIMIVDATGLSRDALHVHIGLCLFIGLHIFLRLSLRNPLPWIALLLLTLGGEWSDLAYETWPDRGMQLGESFRDICNTMFQPTFIGLLAHIFPRLFGVSSISDIREGNPAVARPGIAAPDD